MLVQGKHTPLIEESVFQAAGIRLDAQVARSSKHARPWGERKHWLAGLARCGACGSGLVFSKPHYLKCGYDFLYLVMLLRGRTYLPAGREQFLTEMICLRCQTFLFPLILLDSFRTAQKRIP